MNIFCYFTISHVASVRVIRRNYAHGERNKIRVKKKLELNGIRVIQRDYEELIRQTLLGIEKSSSKDYFELSRIRVKRRQLYKYTPHKLWSFEWNFWKVFCKGVPFW